MPLKDVTIDISVQKVAGLVGLGKPLIVGTKTGGAAFKNYSDLEGLEADFPKETDVYKKALAILGQQNRPATFAVAAYDPEPLGAETAADLVRTLLDEDWFFLVTTETDVAKIEAVADVIEGTERLFSTQVSTLTDLQTLKLKNYDHTFVAVHKTAGEHVDAANVGENGSKTVGSITWKFKSLVGITPQKYSVAEVMDIHDAGGYVYITKAGKNQTSEGHLVSGEYIDVLHGKAWVQINGENAIQVLMQSSPKVPYTNSGIGQMEAALISVFTRAFQQGIIAEDADKLPIFSTNFPTREETSAADRSARVYDLATFEFELAGAIHEARVTGSIKK
ncbi:DUF3383 family protein [Mycobacteroides abscessus]|uniref:DUF3383 family protein n=1 Tax=Mycobacteroides abscessus TaxID=36809 RepID=UPI000C25B818